jgi:hypothetical protein
LINEEVAISHAGDLLSEYNRIILKVETIVSIDQAPIDGFDSNVDEILNVSRLLELVLVDLGYSFVLLKKSLTLHLFCFLILFYIKSHFY